METMQTSNTIAPNRNLTNLIGAGEIQYVTPPMKDFHILYFINKDDFIYFIPGGNVVLPGDIPYSISINLVYALVFNPYTQQYNVTNNLNA